MVEWWCLLIFMTHERYQSFVLEEMLWNISGIAWTNCKCNQEIPKDYIFLFYRCLCSHLFYLVCFFNSQISVGLTLVSCVFIGKDVLAKAKTGTGKTVAFLVKHLTVIYDWVHICLWLKERWSTDLPSII